VYVWVMPIKKPCKNIRERYCLYSGLLRRRLFAGESPRRGALSFAVGLAIGVLPPMPFLHSTLAVTVASLCGLSRAVTFAASWLTFPLATIPLLVASYRLGAWLLPSSSPASSGLVDVHAVTAFVLEHLLQVCAGSIPIAAAVGVAAYLSCRWLQSRRRPRP
jgi:uncharacterized protein (DUF2062 family)